MKKSTRLLCFAPAALLLSLSPGFALQSGENGGRFNHNLTDDVPGAVLLAEITGDGLIDSVCLAAGQLSIHHDIASMDLPILPVVPTGIGDAKTMAVQKGAGVLGGDRLILSYAAGLYSCVLNPVTPGYVWNLIPNTSSAGDASLLKFLDLDGDGIDEFVSLNSTRLQMQVWTIDAAGNPVSPVVMNSSTGPILDVFVGEWTAASTVPELLVVYECELQVLNSATLGLITSKTFIGAAFEADVMRESFGLGTAIVVLEERTTGSRWVTIWRPGVNHSEIGLSLGVIGFRGLCCDDLDMDGNEDIAVIATTIPLFVVFQNLVGVNGVLNGPSITMTDVDAVDYADYGPDFSSQTSRVTLGDVDGDGDSDLVLACEGTGTLAIRLNGYAIQEASQRPRVASEWPFAYVGLVGDPEGIPVDVNIFIPTGLNAIFTEVDVELYGLTSEVPLDRTTLTISGTGSYMTTLHGNVETEEIPDLYIRVIPYGWDSAAGKLAVAPAGVIQVKEAPEGQDSGPGEIIHASGIPPEVIPRPGDVLTMIPPPPPPRPTGPPSDG